MPSYDEAKRKIAMDKAHAEAIEIEAHRIRDGIEALMAGTGFELDVDRWGSEGIVLRHFSPHTESFKYDYETPLEGN